jgi:glycosyltransferase involved in cell wall biosynthesis
MTVTDDVSSNSDLNDVSAPHNESARNSKPSVTLVVPAYNEALIIMGTMKALEDYMVTLEDEFRWEMIVVNDGSKDETGPIIDAFAATRPNVRALHHRTNFNLGQTLRFAFGHCTTDYVVTVDCDLSYSVDHIGRLLRTVHETKAKVVLASPYADDGEVANVPFTRKMLSRYANRMLSFAVKGEVSTLTGMVRAYDRQFLQSLDLSSTDVGINTEIIYKARILKAKVVEVPARLAWVSDEPGGRISKFKVAKSISTYLLSGFLFRPLFVFALPAFTFFLMSVGALLVIVRQAFTENISIGKSFGISPTTTIIAAISLVVSIQFLSLGLLAEQARRNFEYLFHLGTGNLRQTQQLRDELRAR